MAFGWAVVSAGFDTFSADLRARRTASVVTLVEDARWVMAVGWFLAGKVTARWSSHSLTTTRY